MNDPTIVAKAVQGTDNAHVLLRQVAIHSLQERAGYVPYVAAPTHHSDTAFEDRSKAIMSVLVDNTVDDCKPAVAYLLMAWTLLGIKGMTTMAKQRSQYVYLIALLFIMKSRGANVDGLVADAVAAIKKANPGSERFGLRGSLNGYFVSKSRFVRENSIMGLLSSAGQIMTTDDSLLASDNTYRVVMMIASFVNSPYKTKYSLKRRVSYLVVSIIAYFFAFIHWHEVADFVARLLVEIDPKKTQAIATYVKTNNPVWIGIRKKAELWLQLDEQGLENVRNGLLDECRDSVFGKVK